MLILQSQDRFDDVVEFDPSTERIVIRSKTDYSISRDGPVNGHFAQLEGHTLFLYRYAGELHFRIDNSDIQLTDDTDIHLERGHRSVLNITRNGIPIFSWEYKTPIPTPPLQMDITPFVEEEDYDFGIFVRNVVTTRQRRERIYRPVTRT